MSGPAWWRSTPELVGRALQNLVLNAIDAMPPAVGSPFAPVAAQAWSAWKSPTRARG